MINNLIRKNIQELVPYSSARDEYKGDAAIFLDANENPYPSPYNRYPDPLQKALKDRLSTLKAIDPSHIFVGNGSDEAIDLLIRACCEPYQDSILITEPTYGMYKVCADVNAVNIQRVPLLSDFTLDVDQVIHSITPSTKIIFLCSPNNPSGNLLNREAIKLILQKFDGLVVIDEAYIDFARDPGFVSELNRYPNLAILQTLSKAWGLAGLRLGLCFASSEIISVLNKIKYPYNINSVTLRIAYETILARDQMKSHVETILLEREKLRKTLSTLKVVINVYPSDANFLLVKVVDARKIYQTLLQQGIVIRDRSSVKGCENCLRITVGTPTENETLINALKYL
jgi:histidinol-phosphate aminotransferase